MTKSEKNEIWFDALLKTAASDVMYDELEMLPPEEELKEKYQLSRESDRKIRKLIRRNNAKAAAKMRARVLRKVAVAILIILSASSVTVFSVEATRNAIFNAVIEYFDGYTSIKFDDKGNSKIYCPAYLPEGYSETYQRISDGSSLIIYENGRGGEILFEQCHVNAGRFFIDNENTTMSEIILNGSKAYLFLGEDANSLLWESGGLAYMITSKLESEELIKMAESLKK